MQETRPTLIKQYQNNYQGNQAFTVTTNAPETHLCVSLNAIAGAGTLEMRQLTNGLTIGRGAYQLRQVLSATQTDLHSPFGISLMLEGYFDLQLSNRQEHISAGEIWLRIGQVDKLHHRQPSGQRMQGVSFDFSTELLDSWKQDAPQAMQEGIQTLLRNGATHFGYMARANPQLWRLARRLLAAKTETFCDRLHYESLALEFLACFLHPHQQTTGLSRQERRAAHLRNALNQAIDILHEEVVRPPTIAELARRVGINECYLKAGFREQFDETVGSYVRKLRLEKARNLLEKEACSVQHAALSVGFANISYFSSIFKQQYGQLPSQYRA